MRTIAAVAGLTALLAACGGATPGGSAPGGTSQAPAAGSQPAAPAGHALTRVTLRQPYLTSGYSLPFIVAKEKGFYRDAGFDVDIPEGKGSATTTETVGNGSDQFGFADAGTAALLLSKGDPVKVLSVYVQQSPMAFCFDPSKVKFTTPADLKGKTVISFAGDSQLKMLPGVLAKYNLQLSDVNLELVQPSTIVPTLAKTPQGFLLLFDTDFPRVTKAIPGATYVPFSQFGINTYSIGLLTGMAMLRDHPDQVKAFVAASSRGWEYAVAHPDEAIQLALKEFPQADPAYLKGSWAITAKLLHTPNTEGRPLGWMSDKDWQETLDLMHRYGGLTDVKPLDTYYTNAFVPGS